MAIISVPNITQHLYYKGTQVVPWQKDNYVYSNESSYYWGAAGTITFGASSMLVQANDTSSGRGAKAVTSVSCDLTYVDSIKVNVLSIVNASAMKGVAIGNAISSYSAGTASDGYTMYNASTGLQTYDVSAKTGNKFVSLFCMKNAGNGACSQTVDEVYLEYSVGYQVNYDEALGDVEYSNNFNEVTITATPKTDVIFKGFYSNSVLLTNSDTYTFTLTADTSIEARFQSIYHLDAYDDGDGAINVYRYGDSLENVTLSVIANPNYHFVKYTINGTDVTETPYTFTLTGNTVVYAYFEEDEIFHITASSNFNYGSIYISDNDVYSGTLVTIWARPFPDYNFVRWQDGETENPRQITVTENVTLVAIYQRVSDTNGIYQYRCFIKDQLDLEAYPKAFLRVDTFDIRTDLLTNATSSITTMEMLSDVDEGDIVVLYDPKGQTLYTGVINSIEDRTIDCSQMQSFYKGNWIYNTAPSSYLEEEIASLLQDYADGKMRGSSYVDSLVAQRLGGITIDYTGSTVVNLPSTYEENSDSDEWETIDFEEFIYNLYQKYGIVFDFEINVAGTNYVHIKKPTFEKIKVGNNMFAISNMTPITEVEETNRLIIYGSDKTYRTTYVATKNGIVEQPSTTANRFNVTNTEIVFSDDPVADLVAANLPQTMYNHKLEFTLMVKNFIYEFGDFNLGGELDVYYGDEYYNSVLTGYEMQKASNRNITEVDFVCGIVRTKLTQLLSLGKV